jgi:hypothetical protein
MEKWDRNTLIPIIQRECAPKSPINTNLHFHEEAWHYPRRETNPNLLFKAAFKDIAEVYNE